MKTAIYIVIGLLFNQFVYSQIFDDHFIKIWDSNLPIYGDENVCYMKFNDANNGMITTTTIDSMIKLNEYRTNDGGYTWNKVSIEVVNGIFSDLKINGSKYNYVYTKLLEDSLGTLGIRVIFREIDIFSGVVNEKLIPIPTAWFIYGLGLSSVGNSMYLTVRDYYTTNGKLDGLYYSNDGFENINLISNIIPSNIETYNGVSYFYNENKIYTIDDDNIEFLKEEYIHNSEQAFVKLLKFNNGLYTYYRIFNHDETGISTNYQCGIHRIDSNDQTCQYFTNPYSPYPGILNNTLYIGGFNIMKYNLTEDSCLMMNQIDRFSYGDLNFVYNHSRCQFVSDSIGFVFGYIENEDSTWCLFKTTTGQPGYKTYIGHGTAEINEIHTEQRSISVYPNPTVGNIQIDFGNLEESVEFQIYDSQGKILLTGNSSESILEVPLSDLGPGIYHLRIIDHDMEVLLHERIVKQ